MCFVFSSSFGSNGCLPLFGSRPSPSNSSLLCLKQTHVRSTVSTVAEVVAMPPQLIWIFLPKGKKNWNWRRREEKRREEKRSDEEAKAKKTSALHHSLVVHEPTGYFVVSVRVSKSIKKHRRKQ